MKKARNQIIIINNITNVIPSFGLQAALLAGDGILQETETLYLTFNKEKDCLIHFKKPFLIKKGFFNEIEMILAPNSLSQNISSLIDDLIYMRGKYIYLYLYIVMNESFFNRTKSGRKGFF